LGKHKEDQKRDGGPRNTLLEGDLRGVVSVKNAERRGEERRGEEELLLFALAT